MAQASSGADRECASCSSTRAGRERRVRTCQSESLDGDTDEHGSFWRVVPRERERRKRGAAWKHECSAGAERAECAWTRNGVGDRPHTAVHLDAAWSELGSDSRSSGVGDATTRALAGEFRSKPVAQRRTERAREAHRLSLLPPQCRPALSQDRGAAASQPARGSRGRATRSAARKHECSADAEAQRASAVVGAERRHHDRTGLHQQGFRGLKPGEMGEDVTGGSTACHVYDKERWDWVCMLLYGTLACCLCARMLVFSQRLEGCALSFGSLCHSSFVVKHTRETQLVQRCTNRLVA